MNKQEIFTKVKNHLLTQKQVSWVEGVVGCAYRGSNGTMCAVGCLIPDDLYRPEMEGFAYGQGFIDKFPKVRDLFDEGTLEFLHRLQIIHDGADVGEWESALRRLAVEENLEF